MSPRNPPSAIQNPSTPTGTLSHTIAPPVHPSPLPSAFSHSSNSLGLTSPPPTLSTPSISGANRLDVGSRTFVPRAAAKLTIKKADGTEVSLENLTKSTPTPPASAVPSSPNVVLRQGSPGTPNRRPTSIHMETEDQRKSRLAEQEQNDKLKAEAADKEKKEKEKAKVAEEAQTTKVRDVSRAQVKKNSFRFFKN
jgi:translation initiation factor 4G